MRLYYVFSKNHKIGSRLISWASGLLIKDLEKIPSHSSVLMDFENIEEKFIIESTLESGIRILPYSKWLEINEECYKIEYKTEINTNEIFSKLMNTWGKDYDWNAFTYFSICFIKHLLFKIPFPKINAWQQIDKFLCTEVIGIIDQYDNYAMVTPAKMCSDLLKNKAQL